MHACAQVNTRVEECSTVKVGCFLRRTSARCARCARCVALRKLPNIPGLRYTRDRSLKFKVKLPLANM